MGRKYLSFGVEGGTEDKGERCWPVWRGQDGGRPVRTAQRWQSGGNTGARGRRASRARWEIWAMGLGPGQARMASGQFKVELGCTVAVGRPINPFPYSIIFQIVSKGQS
jgi:hypothetical protein